MRTVASSCVVSRHEDRRHKTDYYRVSCLRRKKIASRCCREISPRAQPAARQQAGCSRPAGGIKHMPTESESDCLIDGAKMMGNGDVMMMDVRWM